MPYYCDTMSIGAHGASRPKNFAILTGGGTAGHVFPALAIAEALVEAGHDAQSLIFVGSRQGAESSLVPGAGFRLVSHTLRGFRRSVRPGNVWWSITAIPLLLAATLSCLTLFRRERPRVVVSVGGYASMPASIAALITRVPLVTCSYDLLPGLATRIQARWARVSAVAYMPSALPRAELTGAPVREAIRRRAHNGDSVSLRSALGFPIDFPLVVVVGGSLGSALLNEIAEQLCVHGGDGISLLHLCGDRFFEGSGRNEVRRADGSLRYQRLARSEDMGVVYAAADLVVMRAGASSIAEVATVGVASVIVPWKHAADDHQTLNARLLGDRGAAMVVTENDATIERVRVEVLRLLGDRMALAEMSQRAFEAGEIHRRSRLAEVIDAVAS